MTFEWWLARREPLMKAMAAKVFPELTSVQIDAAWTELETAFRRTTPRDERLVAMCVGAALAKRVKGEGDR